MPMIPIHLVISNFGGLENDCFMSYNTLTPNDFSDIIMYINFHYQVAYRNNTQSGSHGDFCNYHVGTRHFLFYYHLWLSERRHLLNLAVVPMLSEAAMRQSSQATSSSDASSSSTCAAKSKKARNAKRNSAQMAATEQSQKITQALVSLEKTNEERVPNSSGNICFLLSERVA